MEQLLDDYEEPKLKSEIEEELTNYVEKRVSEGGAAPL